MEFQDLDSGVTGSSSAVYNANDSEHYENFNHDVISASVNNDQTNQADVTRQHMDKMGSEVNDCDLEQDENADSFFYEEYDVADTVVSSTDNNEAYSFEADQDNQDTNSSFNIAHQTADHDYTAERDTFGDQADNDDVRGKEKFNVESLNYELQVGYRILSNMMSASNRCVNKLFLYPVDDNYPETSDYYEKIKEPMWMFKMKEKFESLQYKGLTDFMADFRLMIENCYRFNGPDNFVSKRAQKLETMMKQKIALLSRDLREKILGNNTEDDVLTSAGIRRRIRNPNMADDPSQQLLSQLRRDRVLQEKVDRRQKVEDRKAMEQARVQELQDWEDRMLGPDVKDKIRTMWELPQIGLFVYLCMESLGLEEEVTQYQLERGIALPRECSDFRRLMTCLLSTPHQRKSLKSFMPYHVWNTKLTAKIDYLYKVLADNNGNYIQACYKLGLDTRAYKMMGKSNPLLKKKFHELSYLKRVWILKNYCDFCMETQQYLQKTIDEIEAVRPMDVREVLLGSDGKGYRYINFPMFTGKDIRIFKHPKTPEPSMESLAMVDWSLEADKPSASSSRCSTPVSQKNHRAGETPSTSLRARALLQAAAESKEASPLRDIARSDGVENTPQSLSSNNTDHLKGIAKVGSNKKRKRYSIFTGKRKRLKAGSRKSAVTSKPSEGCVENDEECKNIGGDTVQNGDNSLVDDALNKTLELNDSVKTEEAVEELQSSKSTHNADEGDESARQMKYGMQENGIASGGVKDELLKGAEEISVSNENKPAVQTTAETVNSDIKRVVLKTEPKEEERDEAKGMTTEDKKSVEVKQEVKDETFSKQSLSESSSLEKLKSEEEAEDAETDEDDLPDVGHIELVAESMEDLRQLMNKLSNPEPIKRGKRTYPGVMKPCEEELLENITRFHEELLKYEKNLANARVSMQSKLRKEVESYMESKTDESKGWDSDHSQTSKDSSDGEEVPTKSDSDTVRQSKRIKTKQSTPTTTALLSSAASKLSSITGEGNEDSNDSFELDISSRGRLRKRRVIPNNTEDTGIKKRKNIPNQDSFFSNQLSPPASTAASVIPDQAAGQPHNNNSISSDILSMLKSPQPNSAIKSQLSTPTGQVLRLVAPSSDGTIRTVRVSSKPNMIISSQSLSNLRFITSTGVVTFPRNTITTSSAQTSHPVIQQLLLNQSRLSGQPATKTVNSVPRLGKPVQLQGSQTSASGAVKLSHVITVPSSVSTLSSKMISPQSGSQAGVKQALDIGLSVTQIQQLIKNQAIQINTATGNPATLVLTGGLHSMANKPGPTSTASLIANSPLQMRMQASSTAATNQLIKVPATGASSLLSVMNRNPSTQSQVLISSKNLTPLATISGHNLPQLIRPQSSTVVRVSTPLNTVNVPSQVARFSDASSFAGKVVSANAVVRQGIVRTAVSASQKIIPVPRIISSLNPLTNLRMSVAPNVNASQAPLVSSTSQVIGGVTLELAKARVINVPGMSPAKKYAGNVTVKALLENRGPKKQGEDDLDFEQASDQAGSLDNCESTHVSSSDNDNSIYLATSNVQSKKSDTSLPFSSYSLTSPNVSTFIPHTLPLSVDTGISSRTVTATSSEVIVPTVNIKVPSPNTLPSVLHNKNGTTIVQSTKVPIPVASEAKTGDSLSPVYQQSSPAPTINTFARVSNLSGAGEVTNVSNSIVKQASSIAAGQHLPGSVTSMKNVMLKVSPQTGGPGQFVQGYMTPRGLVIPQAALLQQQQGNSVIISGVSQAGSIAQIQPGQIHIQQSAVNVSGGQQNFSLAARPTITQHLQQPPPQQIVVNSSGSSGMYNPNPSLKVMFLNSTCGQSSLTTNSIISSVQQQPTNTPASELVKQLASNSHNQIHPQQSVAMSPSSNQQSSHILSNMIQGNNLQMSNATILPTQTIVNAGVSPQLAQIFTLQQGNQIQQQPNTVITTKPLSVQNKPSVVAVQLQQLGQILNLGNVSQVQLPHPQMASLQQLGSAGRIAQPNQVLQLAINQQVGGQTLVAAQQGPQIVRVATQLSPQIQNQGLSSSLQSQGNIIIQQQQGQNIVLQQQAVVGNASNQQFSALQVSKAPAVATTNIQTTVVGQAQNTSSHVISQLQSPVVSTPASINQFQYVYNTSTAAQAGFTVVSSPLNKLSVGGSVAGTVNRIIRADSSSTLTMLPSQGNVLGNTIRHAAALNNKGGISQMIIPSSATGQFLISPVKLTAQAQQANIISPIKYIQSPNSVSGQAPNQFLINSALSGVPAQVSIKPSVIYANQASGDKKEGKVAQILLSRPGGPSLSTSHQAGSGISVSVAAAPVTAKLSGGDTGAKTILYKIGDQYFSPASSLSGLQQGASQNTSTANLTPVASNSKMDVQLLVPPACIEASDQILKHSNTVSPANVIPSTVALGASACQNLAQNRSVGVVRNPEPAVNSVNGVHHGNAQFSFSLSGPATLNNKSSLRPDGLLMLNGQGPFSASGQAPGNSQEATSASPAQLNSSIGQYSGGDQACPKLQPGQRLSNNEISLQEQNEKEAALNLLTFANQPI